MSLDEFTEVIKSLDPEKDEIFIVTMFRKALELEMDVDNLDVMSPASFVEVALQENLGDYGRFRFEEISLAEELKEISMKHAIAQSKKVGVKKIINRIKLV